MYTVVSEMNFLMNTGLLHFAHYSSFAFRVVELLNSASPRPNKIFISWNIQFSHGLGDAQNTFKRNHLTKISKGAEEDPHILPLSIFPISIQLLPNETKSLGEWSSHQINKIKIEKKKKKPVHRNRVTGSRQMRTCGRRKVQQVVIVVNGAGELQTKKGRAACDYVTPYETLAPLFLHLFVPFGKC